MIVYVCLVLLFIWNIILTVMTAHKSGCKSKVNDRYNHKFTLDLVHKSFDNRGVQQSYVYKSGLVTKFLIEKCDSYGIKISNIKHDKYVEKLSIDMVCTDTELNLIMLELFEEFKDIKIDKM